MGGLSELRIFEINGRAGSGIIKDGAALRDVEMVVCRALADKFSRRKEATHGLTFLLADDA